ncbi:hypothetical protein [Desulfovibrio sp.]|uniref:hypothetical protein n=1 Tax=Desulfovibrio sp. TaxID=885 RepID=UPI0023CF153A|nr:hypothetical protein [Desulfovibrio sp.]MDE7240669.1 hypothetical protein [Desulfovibrio sp.]
MLKPFYQGKLDTFCAIYAVLNALRLLYGIRVLKARDILNETLMGLASRPEAFRAVLTQETDYIALVDNLLRIQSRAYPLDIRAPYVQGPQPGPDDFFAACKDWLAPGRGRAIVFRFLRSLTPDGGPMNRHWTTADRVDGDILHLFDCSHEAEAILNINRASFVTSADRVSLERLLHIQPESARFLRVPF